MRIIAGSLRRRTLVIPKGLSVRPTSDRVRESVFNWLHSRMDFQGTAVLDLFAGSGAVGIEALSRGAERSWLVERSAPVADQIRRNAEALGIPDEVTVITAEAVGWLRRARSYRFDLIYADPPYDYAHPDVVVDAAMTHLVPGGFFLFEHAERDRFKEHPDLVDERRYGKTSVSFFVAPESEALESDSPESNAPENDSPEDHSHDGELP
ncbi:MAG: 16S rRNA (guanine966-N2)-methyltransferase [Rhodothermales bacterium]|jgi:16S rRNA (guanine966-N2)-methyltransferase